MVSLSRMNVPHQNKQIKDNNKDNNNKNDNKTSRLVLRIGRGWGGVSPAFTSLAACCVLLISDILFILMGRR